MRKKTQSEGQFRGVKEKTKSTHKNEVAVKPKGLRGKLKGAVDSRPKTRLIHTNATPGEEATNHIKDQQAQENYRTESKKLREVATKNYIKKRQQKQPAEQPKSVRTGSGERKLSQPGSRADPCKQADLTTLHIEPKHTKVKIAKVTYTKGQHLGATAQSQTSMRTGNGRRRQPQPGSCADHCRKKKRRTSPRKDQTSRSKPYSDPKPVNGTSHAQTHKDSKKQ